MISLNGTKGYVYEGSLSMIDASENPGFKKFMSIVDKFRRLGVRTNADTAEDAAIARNFGAEGIGLFRTEHMFYGVNSEKPLFALRKMILSSSLEERIKALSELFPFVKKDIKETLKVMKGLPVTIRLLDPPLHEFVPQSEDKQKELADSLGISVADVKNRAESLHESNPMMGHRGVRLGITYPEITEMQVRAVLEAAAELKKEGVKCNPEIMIPVTCDVAEIKKQRAVANRVAAEVKAKFKQNIDCKYGTMIEIPRAALLADKMAEEAEFFSFGTNDLTQLTFGFSRDDIGGFMNDYLDQKILSCDPFQSIDQSGVGQLIEMAVKLGRKTRENLKIGICGEQGGEAKSVAFCHKTGLNYVSCSPFRIPIARLAAAQAAISEKKSASAPKMVAKAVKSKGKGKGEKMVTAKKPTVKKAAPKKAAAKPAVKKVAPKKAAAKPAVKKAAPKKAAAKPAVKKAAAKPAVKKAAPKKVVAKKPAAKKVAKKK